MSAFNGITAKMCQYAATGDATTFLPSHGAMERLQLISSRRSYCTKVAIKDMDARNP